MQVITAANIGEWNPDGRKVFGQELFDSASIPAYLAGNSPNVSRVDVTNHGMNALPFFHALMGQFWRPEEINMDVDALDVKNLTPEELHIFMNNLKFQTLLDSVQTRGVACALMPLVSEPVNEIYVSTWGFTESIHSVSYTHLLQAIQSTQNMNQVFNGVVTDTELIRRAASVCDAYNRLISYNQLAHSFGYGTHTVQMQNRAPVTLKLTRQDHINLLVENFVSIGTLEGLRFYVSFLCTFAFTKFRSKMTGSGNIIKLIARDELQHLEYVQKLLKSIREGKQGDAFKQAWDSQKDKFIEIYRRTAEEEMAWAAFLMPDKNKFYIEELTQENMQEYVRYLTNIRMQALDLPLLYPDSLQNPHAWVNAFYNEATQQIAPKETENILYLASTEHDSAANAWKELTKADTPEGMTEELAGSTGSGMGDLINRYLRQPAIHPAKETFVETM